MGIIQSTNSLSNQCKNEKCVFFEYPNMEGGGFYEEDSHKKIRILSF